MPVVPADKSQWRWKPECAASYEVLLAGGRRVIRVPARFELEAVRALVAAVEGASC